MIEAQVAALYPPASAREVLRSLRGSEGPGAVVFFTGLSGSGKSTIARALADELADAGPRRVTLLDGDEVRQHLSRGLGFDAASREINVDRIAWVAARSSPRTAGSPSRRRSPRSPPGAATPARSPSGRARFLLVWVSTPLDVCEARDRKGLYARARAGEVADFTGISSPYEPPDDADVVIDTTDVDVPEAVRRIRAALDARLATAAPDQAGGASACRPGSRRAHRSRPRRASTRDQVPRRDPDELRSARRGSGAPRCRASPSAGASRVGRFGREPLAYSTPIAIDGGDRRRDGDRRLVVAVQGARRHRGERLEVADDPDPARGDRIDHLARHPAGLVERPLRRFDARRGGGWLEPAFM